MIGFIIFITTIAGVCGTGLGGVIGAIFGKNSSKTISLLLSFAGGVMLAIVCFDLIPESLSAQDGENEIPFFITLAGIIIGYASVFYLSSLIDDRSKRKSMSLDNKIKDNKFNLFIAGVVMAFAIALHNMPEGMVIGASYVNQDKNIISGSGFILALIIGFHNIPEGMAVSVPLVSGGMKKVKAIFVTALTGTPTIIGAIIGYYIGTFSALGLAIALSFASGAMLYVVLGELLRESFLLLKSKMPALFVLIGILLGFVLVQI